MNEFVFSFSDTFRVGLAIAFVVTGRNLIGCNNGHNRYTSDTPHSTTHQVSELVWTNEAIGLSSVVVRGKSAKT